MFSLEVRADDEAPPADDAPADDAPAGDAPAGDAEAAPAAAESSLERFAPYELLFKTLSLTFAVLLMKF
ncbi:hypothetical protein TNCV_4829731 [Trichonephila clavipes]|nr:hypothetical protein TNCV_4829731 [Trichonephila clavipes]